MTKKNENQKMTLWRNADSTCDELTYTITGISFEMMFNLYDVARNAVLNYCFDLRPGFNIDLAISILSFFLRSGIFSEGASATLSRYNEYKKNKD